MCGISGYFYFERERAVKAEVLKRMTDIISHRGPDGEGFYVRDNVALALNRSRAICRGVSPLFTDIRWMKFVERN